MDLHQLADATVSVPILALDSGRNACRMDEGVGSMAKTWSSEKARNFPVTFGSSRHDSVGFAADDDAHSFLPSDI